MADNKTCVFIVAGAYIAKVTEVPLELGRGARGFTGVWNPVTAKYVFPGLAPNEYAAFQGLKKRCLLTMGERTVQGKKMTDSVDEDPGQQSSQLKILEDEMIAASAYLFRQYLNCLR